MSQAAYVIVLEVPGAGAVEVATETVVCLPVPEVHVVAVGEQGPPGRDGTRSPYTHNQASALAIWTVNHNFGVKPAAAAAYTVGGRQMLASIQHISSNQLIIVFDEPTVGYAICN